MLDPRAVRHGRVRGRYFRENFAQAGIDLVQIVPELVTNADAAIAASGGPVGRIELAFAPPDRDWLTRCRAPQAARAGAARLAQRGRLHRRRRGRLGCTSAQAPDRSAVRDYLIGKGVESRDAEARAKAITVPLVVTMRGALAFGRKL
jgi:hypothetical protein